MGLKSDVEEIKKEAQELKEQSLAMELLKDQRKQNKRLFIIIITLMFLWFITIGIFVYYISHYTYEEEYSEQTIEDVENIDGSNIINGDVYGEDKTS